MSQKSKAARRRLATVVFTGLLVSLIATGCDDAPEAETKSAAALLQDARQSVEEGNMRAALINAKNALRKEPELLEARALLAKVYIDAADAFNAEKELMKLRNTGAPLEDWLPLLGRAWIAQGKGQQVLDELTIPEGSTPKEQGILLSQHGQAFLSLGDLDSSLKTFQEANRLAPDLVAPYLGLARLALIGDDLAGAQNLLSKAAAISSNSPDISFLKGDLALRQGNPAEAIAAYHETAERMPLNPVPKISLARAQIASGNLEEAEKNIKQLKKILKDHPAVISLEATLAFQRDDYAETDKLTSKLLSRDPDDSNALMMASAAKYEMEEFEQASKFMGGYLAENPDNDRARRLYGAILYQLKQGDKAFEVLKPLAAKYEQDANFLKLIGASAVQGRFLEQGREYFSRVATLNPEDASTQAQLGAININLGDQKEAIKNLERAVELDPQLDSAVFTLFSTLLHNKEFGKALDVAVKLQNDRPDNAVGYSLEGIVHIAQKDQKKARVAFVRSLEVDPSSPVAAKNLAQLDILEKDFESARRYMEHGVSHNPNNSELLVMLALLEAELNNRDKARELLQTAIDRQPDDLEPRIRLAKVYLGDGAPYKALGVTQSKLLDHPDDPELLTVVAQAQMVAEEHDNAVTTLQRLVEQAPEDGFGHYLLATAYLNTGEVKRMKESLERVIELTPKHRDSRMHLSRLYVQDGEFEKAEELFKPMKPEEGIDPEILKLEGMIALGRNQPEVAVALLEDGTAQISEPDRDLVLMLSEAQWFADSKAEAQRIISDWLANNPQDHQARFTYALRAMENDEKQLAVGEFRQVVAAEPRNWAARNNLAWLLYQLGDIAAAAQEVDQLLRSSSQQPIALHTAGVIYLANKDLPAALNALQQAANLAPRNPAYRFHLAQALIENGDKDEAVRQLQAALSSNAEFSERNEAEQLLKGITAAN